jgi:hypothetical protein
MNHIGVVTPSQSDEITTREALEILGMRDPSSISDMVLKSRLTPSRKLPGKTGAYLFFRRDIEALAQVRAAAAVKAAS